MASSRGPSTLTGSESHWRATGQVALFGGVDGDYLGQYRDNSFAAAFLRFSF